jgi:hypothetical protein
VTGTAAELFKTARASRLELEGGVPDVEVTDQARRRVLTAEFRGGHAPTDVATVRESRTLLSSTRRLRELADEVRGDETL